MPESAHDNKLPQTVFAFFVWQADLVREITPGEAEAFFDFLSGGKPDTTHGPLKSELSELANTRRPGAEQGVDADRRDETRDDERTR